MRAPRWMMLVGAALVVVAAPAAAQQAGAGQADPPAAAAGSDPLLKLEREVFLYPVEFRRDPFESLADRDDLGPRFEELVLRGIIYAAGGGSVALLADGGGRRYRVRRGGIVGNARVIDISERRVVFAVETFGIIRQERLELKRKEGVDG